MCMAYIIHKQGEHHMTQKIGYANGATTYGEVRAAMKFTDRVLGAVGDFLDRHFHGNGPIFPKDAPLHQPNCGVVAMCMFADRPYSDVVPIMARGRSRGWKGTTYQHQYSPCATELGFNATEAQFKGTLAKLAASTKGTQERTFAVVRGHAICVWDGLIFDQGHPAGETPAKHPSASKRVIYTLTRA